MHTEVSIRVFIRSLDRVISNLGNTIDSGQRITLSKRALLTNIIVDGGARLRQGNLGHIKGLRLAQSDIKRRKRGARR